MPYSYNEKDLTITISPNKADENGTPIARAYINEMLKKRHMTITGVVRLINERFPEDKTTTQNLSNKLARGSLRDFEIAQIAEVCNFELCLVGHEVSGTAEAKQKDFISRKQSENEKIKLYISEGYEMVNSVNFGVIIVAGAKATSAAQFINDNVKPEISVIDELALCSLAESKFNVIAKPSTNTFGD